MEANGRQTAGKRQADRSCRGAGKLSQPRKTSSTPAVVPGAAPALGKAGVGGFFLNSKNSHCPKERKKFDPVIVIVYPPVVKHDLLEKSLV